MSKTNNIAELGEALGMALAGLAQFLFTDRRRKHVENLALRCTFRNIYGDTWAFSNEQDMYSFSDGYFSALKLWESVDNKIPDEPTAYHNARAFDAGKAACFAANAWRPTRPVPQPRAAPRPTFAT